MLLRISGQNVKISSDFKAYVAEKAASLAKYYHNLDNVTVTLRRGTNGSAIAGTWSGNSPKPRAGETGNTPPSRPRPTG
jgi:ribosomal subunit interface protein